MSSDIINHINNTADVTALQNDDALIDDLSKLPLLEYERQREEAASTLGIKRVSMLDKLVNQRKVETEAQAESNELLEGIEPWEYAVDGTELASTIINTFHRHTILPDGGDIALTLWALGTYCFNAFRIFPKLCLSSPEKRCGKTTTMETLSALAHRSLMASNVSASTLFRSIECWQPSLLIDEGDTFIDGNEELRGIINSGHTRSGASVLRCTGEDHEPKQFSTWAPMAISMIKTPPDTIKDRSVMVTLRRKMPGEHVTRLPIELGELFKGHRRQCQRWALDNLPILKTAEPDTPKVGSDRAEDNWWALLAIADQLGGEWPNRAREAMIVLEGNKTSDDEGIGPMILGDIQSIFKDKRAHKISSEDLVNALIDLEERPWCEWKHGKPMTKVSLARMLKPYGIKSKKFRDGYSTKNGYDLDGFQDAFHRYLPVGDTLLGQFPISNGTTEQPSNGGACSVPTSKTNSEQVGTSPQLGTNVPTPTRNTFESEHNSEHYNPVSTWPTEKCSVVPTKNGNTEKECVAEDKNEGFML
jgi:hypothetical protein